jgi:hypothetical protein
MSIVVIKFIIDPNDSPGPGHKDKNNVMDARNIALEGTSVSLLTNLQKGYLRRFASYYQIKIVANIKNPAMLVNIVIDSI